MPKPSKTLAHILDHVFPELENVTLFHDGAARIADEETPTTLERCLTIHLEWTTRSPVLVACINKVFRRDVNHNFGYRQDRVCGYRRYNFDTSRGIREPTPYY
jgi:hypothetical protein